MPEHALHLQRMSYIAKCFYAQYLFISVYFTWSLSSSAVNHYTSCLWLCLVLNIEQNRAALLHFLQMASARTSFLFVLLRYAPLLSSLRGKQHIL